VNRLVEHRQVRPDSAVSQPPDGVIREQVSGFITHRFGRNRGEGLGSSASNFN
jgi:hypothetical protein